MQLFGYDEDLSIVPVTLTPAEIVEAQIDPWRLDIFDKYPRVVSIAGRTLRFRRLQDLAFAYSNDKRVVVGIHDGQNSVCVHGADVKDNALLLADIRPCPESFDSHLVAYLEQRERDLKNYVDFFSSTVNLSWNEIEPELRTRAPVPTASLTLIANGLQMATLPPLCPGILTGATLDYLDIPVTLPEPLRWLQKALSNWETVIFGAAVRKSMLGEPPSHVEFMIDAAWLPAMEKHLRTTLAIEPIDQFVGIYPSRLAGSKAFDFYHEGCLFSCFVKMQGPFRQWLLDRGMYSVDDMYLHSSIPMIKASRLALFDTSKKQARSMRVLVGCIESSSFTGKLSARLPLFGPPAVAKSDHRHQAVIKGTAGQILLNEGYRILEMAL